MDRILAGIYNFTVLMPKKKTKRAARPAAKDRIYLWPLIFLEIYSGYAGNFKWTVNHKHLTADC